MTLNAPAPLIVPVDLGQRSYDIVIGSQLLDRASDYLSQVLVSGRVAIVTDQTVYDLHGARLMAALSSYNPTLIIRPPGEGQKSFDGLQAVLAALFEAGLGRGDCVIAFGGGVIGDLSGFAASIYKRGCQFVQIPTTLLAQVDSSVGGKTAINSRYGKNLIGAFYQPQLVLADMDVLATLDERQLKAGYAEVLKYGLLGEREFFDWLCVHGRDVLALEPLALARAVATSCQAKARIVGADEYERGARALLNLGHSFAHALELEAGYNGDLLHGEAVSAGMEMAFEYSASSGLCSPEDVTQLKSHLQELGLTQLSDLSGLLKDPERLLAHMDQDKKNQNGELTLILVRAIGEAFVHKNSPRELVLEYLTGLTHLKPVER